MLSDEQIQTLKARGLTDEKIKALADYKGLEIPEKSLLRRVGESVIQSQRNFGQSIAGAIGNVGLGGTKKSIDEANQLNDQVRGNLIATIKSKRERGEDTSRLINALKTLDKEVNFFEILNDSTGGSLNKTAKQVFGEGLGVATDVASFGTIPALAGKAMVGQGVKEGVKQGAKIGATAGGVFGGAQSVARSMQEDDTTGEVIGSGLAGGTVGLVSGGLIGGVLGGVSGKLQANKAIKAQTLELMRNNPDARVARYMLDGQGRIVNDKKAQEAIKQGLDEGVVATIKGASAKDKIKAGRALDILVRGKTEPTYKALNRPSDVIGESLMERIKVVQNANNTAGSQLDTVAKNLKGQKIDYQPAVQAMLDDLDDLGITINNGKLNYKGSDIEGLNAPQSVLNNFVKRVQTVSDDGYELHRLKRFIDENVQYGKTGDGLSGRVEGILKNFRRNIDSLLDNTSSEYNVANTIYSDTRNAIDDFLDVAGSRFDIKDVNASKKIGTLARRILSNASSRIDVANSMQKLQDVAEKYGGKFDDDLITQVVFVNDLERIFGTSAPTSLAGEVTKGVQQATGIARKLKNSQGATDLALQATGEIIEKARGINEENLIKAIRQLLVD